MRRSEAEQEEHAAANRRALKRAEAAALALLLALHRRSQREAANLPHQLATEHVARVMHGGVLAVRRVARESRLIRSAAELESLGVDAIAASRSEAVIVDHMRAARAALSFAETQTDGALRRIAVTENAQAFSDVTVAAPGVVLLRRWDALLDACPVCWSLDGQLTPLGQTFSGYEPGSVHPHCRCTWSLVSDREVAGGARQQPFVVIRPAEAAQRESATPKLAAAGYLREQRTERAARAYERMLRSEVVPQQLKQARRTKEFKALLCGIDERQLDFLRSGYRPRLTPYAGAVGAQINRIATGAEVPAGSKQPLPPIVINIFPRSERFRTPGAIAQLQDGRHRLEAAQAAGATEIRAKIRLYDRELNTVWESDRIIPVPRPDPTNRHERMH